MDELFEVLTLIQTGKITRVPIVLMGSSFWNGLSEWFKTAMLDAEQTISAKDFDLFHITDDVEDAVNYVNAFYSIDKPDNRLAPNYEL
jgi:predicted Rossmann-fold nucleotide-binding protein